MSLRTILSALTLLMPMTALAQADSSPSHLTSSETSIVVPFRLGSPFGDHMVLQRDVEVPIWGTDAPGQEIVVISGERRWRAQADASGRWEAAIGPFEAPGPYRIEVAGTQTAEFKDVLAGEVWLASGQSNMEWSLNAAADSEAAIAAADLPHIRLLTIPRVGKTEPADQVPHTGWKLCTPAAAREFSAIGFHFARELHEELDVPIGVIVNAWGGAWMEAYTPLELMAGDPVLGWTTDAYDSHQQAVASDENQEFLRAMAHWHDVVTEGRGYHVDPGDDGLEQGYHEPDFDDGDWKQVTIPGGAAVLLSESDGVTWFRREFDLGPGATEAELTVSLGLMDSTDQAWLNGVRIGGIGFDRPFWSTERHYPVPAGVAREGRNVLALRVMEQSWNSEIFHSPDQMRIAGDGVHLSLTGAWRCHVSAPLPPKPKSPLPEDRQVPGMLFNGMVHPMVPMRLAGVIWYQGESNRDRAEQYRHLSEVMIDSWRNAFRREDLPFLFVQLAGWEPGAELWPVVMDAQRRTLELPHTAMATAADVGDRKDIHPRDKATVAHRLALAARATVYGEDIVHSGPLVTSATLDGRAVRIEFDHVGGGLRSRSGGNEVHGFEAAGADGQFQPARASINGGTVVLTIEGVENPKTVRYDWVPFPACDLENAEGLPASLFELEISGG